MTSALLLSGGASLAAIRGAREFFDTGRVAKPPIRMPMHDHARVRQPA
jgi:hypothetical protein